MEETNKLSQTTFVRSGSVLSRFDEQFSDSSGSSPPMCTSSRHVGYPHHIIQQLRAEQDKAKKRSLSAAQKSCQQRKTLAQERTRRMSTPTALAYERRRNVAKEMVDKHRHAKEARKIHEKEHKRKSRLGGTMWGYDPVAGRVSERHNPPNAQHHVHGCYIFRGARDESDEYGIDEIDSLGRRTGRQWLQGSKWGIECGGPGRDPHFECNHSTPAQDEDDRDVLRRKRMQGRSLSLLPPTHSKGKL